MLLLESGLEELSGWEEVTDSDEAVVPISQGSSLFPMHLWEMHE